MSQDGHWPNGRYIAGGIALIIFLITLNHIFFKDATMIESICIPVLIMFIYIIWILYLAKKDKLKDTENRMRVLPSVGERISETEETTISIT